MRKNYKRIWENFHNTKLPFNMEIHHIDGDRSNNNPENLIAVTIEEHLQIHLQQKDYGAVQAILMRMKRTEDHQSLLKSSASKHQKELLEEGKHNFQNIDKQTRSNISKMAGLMTRDMKKGIHQINSDPIKAREKSRMAGLISLNKKAGFHDPTKSGSNFVKNTSWWININNGERKRSSESPGNEWIKGMKIES